MRLGSLFTGYGGLDQGISHVLPTEVAWVSDIDPGACKILAHRYPDVPNLGDITRIDWASVEPVDILTGGFPCQDLSVAGLQAGLKPGTRSGLWTHMAYAIDQLRPRLVIIENVRGLLSAAAHSDVEPCPWCMGGAADGEPALRALGAVLGDLADLGYDAAWHGLRAADVGAPHGRFRIFVVAWPAGDPNGIGPEWDRDARQWGNGPADDGQPAQDAKAAPDTDDAGREECWGPLAVPAQLDTPECPVPDATGDGRDERRPQPTRFVGGPDVVQRGDAAPDTDRGRHGFTEDRRGMGRVDIGDASTSRQRQRPRPRPEPGDRGPADAPDTDSDGLPLVGRIEPLERDLDGRRGSDIAWGAYEPAIRRWEHILDRTAPPPTERDLAGWRAKLERRKANHRPVGLRGRIPLKPQPRLAPQFVEWMMGLPAGWVTDVPDLSRNDQLKALGNGVLPQQAAAAVRFMLTVVASGVAA